MNGQCRQDLQRDLWIAFNPSSELRSGHPMNQDERNGYHPDSLSRAEWIAQGCNVRYQLKRQLSDSDYRILQAFFTEAGDLDHLAMTLDPLKTALIKAAKIHATLNPMFINLVCASVCWHTNLFRDKDYGGMHHYTSEGRSRRLLGQRRKRLEQVLEGMRLDAISKAGQVLIEAA